LLIAPDDFADPIVIVHRRAPRHVSSARDLPPPVVLGAPDHRERAQRGLRKDFAAALLLAGDPVRGAPEYLYTVEAALRISA
jgi:hypothetical protein